MQDDFFDDVVNNRDSKHRYFAIMEDLDVETLKMTGTIPAPYFIGMGGITNIEWENGTAEISLIIDPGYRGKGYGKEAVKLIRDEGLNSLRLQSIYGEVYYCGNYKFWEKIVETYGGYSTRLLNRKVYNGKLYDSIWFEIGVRR